MVRKLRGLIMLSSEHQSLTIAPLCLYNNGIHKQIRIELAPIDTLEQFYFVVKQELKAFKERCKMGLIPNVKPAEIGLFYPVDEFIILEGFNIDDEFYSDYSLHNGYFEAKKLVNDGIDEAAIEAYFQAVSWNHQDFKASEFERLYLGHYGDEYNFAEHLLDVELDGQLEESPLFKYLHFEDIYKEYFFFEYPCSNGYFFTIRGNWPYKEAKAA